MVALPIGEIRIVVPCPSYPYRWKCTQVVPTEPTTIGEKLKLARLQRHLFQSEVARKFGVDPASIQNWERNRYAPSKRHISLILNWIEDIQTDADASKTTRRGSIP